MRKYYILLISLTIILILAAFCTLWFGNAVFQTIFPFIPLYFAVVTGIQHYAVIKSFSGSLFLHLVVISVWSFTHIQMAKPFIIAFCICYILYLLFETIALVLFVKNKRKQ